MDCNIIPLPYRSGVACSLARPAVVQQQHGGIRSPAVFFFFSYFNDSFQINYFSICRAELRQICRFGTTMVVDVQHKRRLP